MRYLSAHYVFPVNAPPIRNGIITLADDGTILALTDPGNIITEKAGMEFYSGVLVPGFVNTHCHLELSGLHGKIAPRTGMSGFVSQIAAQRQLPESQLLLKAQLADSSLWHTGTVAVADIANTVAFAELKGQSPIAYFTLLEVFGLNPAMAVSVMDKTIAMRQSLPEDYIFAITPHAPYSVSPQLLDEIVGQWQPGLFLSVHFKESSDEAGLFAGEKNTLSEFTDSVYPGSSAQFARYRQPINYLLAHIPENIPLLLVHNCHTSAEDIAQLQKRSGRVIWSICPNSNVYIGNPLPPINLLRASEFDITIGTDSLASNTTLSIIEELITLHRHFPDIAFGELLPWATINGARLLGLQHRLGTIEPGKKPGIVLLENFDFETMNLTNNTTARRL